MFMENKDNQKNETIGVKKKGNRRYSMLLLALLFIGTATYGTYAYFTDSTSVDGSIKLSTGTVSLSQINSTEWVYEGEGKNTLIENTYENLQPGDGFKKTVEIKYLGTLNATIAQKTAEIASVEGFSYTIEFKNEQGEEFDFTKKITPNTVINVIFTAKVNDTKEKQNTNQLDLDSLTDAVTLTVEQLKK